MARPGTSKVRKSYGFRYQEAPQAYVQEEAPQAASQDPPPAPQQEVKRLLLPRPPYGEAGFLCSCGFAGWVLCRVFVFVERMCGSPVWGGARYLRDWDYD